MAKPSFKYDPNSDTLIITLSNRSDGEEEVHEFGPGIVIIVGDGKKVYRITIIGFCEAFPDLCNQYQSGKNIYERLHKELSRLIQF